MIRVKGGKTLRKQKRRMLRTHPIEGSDDGPETLQRRISMQIKEASKILDVGESISDMPFVPRGPYLPTDLFKWYTLSEDTAQDQDTFYSIMTIMVILAEDSI